MPPTTAQDWPGGWLITTIVPFSAKSAYGLESGRFEAGAFAGSAVGLGKDLVALGAMRNVDAGARTFFSSGFGTLAVWGIGSVHVSIVLRLVK